MAGRALIGVVVGGFWSLSAATAMRLVPPQQLPRALAVFNGGNALATVIAAPLGSYLGSIIGWRGAFFLLVAGGGHCFRLAVGQPTVHAGAASPGKLRQRAQAAQKPSGPYGHAGGECILYGAVCAVHLSASIS